MRKGLSVDDYSKEYWKKYAEVLRGIIILQNIVITITFLIIFLILILS